MKKLLITIIAIGLAVVCSNAEEAPGVVLPLDLDRAVFMVDWKNGMAKAKASATAENADVVVLRSRFVGIDGIDSNSIFHTRYRGALEAASFTKKLPYLVCACNRHAIGLIYFQVLKDGKWSEEKTATGQGQEFVIVSLDKEIKGVRIIKIQFK